ncbi:unnamed protein product [Rotaria socialis]|uniref:Uncharacterized protein n=1 Tax=Rotaria socialis TaxID=392032 RepID=A0A820ZFY1_9BILA|nr:unnamed protein product [Rotaria socialis]CAF4553167.1 unnamed protein product [Rotaria socialis]CAF4559627.1 unnamed protein product [Rotaria socialis]
MDTEDDALTHKPAALQVEYIKHNLSSIIIIIEVQYLPSSTSRLFKKIQQLCSIIFTSQNYIYSWGSALQELTTLAEWTCGVDLMLGTYLPLDVVGRERAYRLHEEKKYRSILQEYAINGVFAVTKIAYKMNLIKFTTLPSTIQYEAISDDEDELQMQSELSINIEQQYDELIVHDTDELEENELLQQQEDIEVFQPNQQISIINQ